ADRAARARRGGPVRQARPARAGRVHRALHGLRRQRQRADAHGAGAGRPDAGVFRLHRPGDVRLPGPPRAVRGRLVRALLVLRTAPVPTRTLPLHARPHRGARLGRALAVALGGPPAAALGVTWPRAPLLLVSSSSRTGPVEGLISLARELRGQGLDARFAGDTVRSGENLGEHLAHAGVPWETGLRPSRKVRLRDLIHDSARLAAFARERRYDVFHAAFAHDHSLALWAARRGRNPEL